MQESRPVRVPVYIEADLFSGGNSYAGFIGNLSELGLYVETAPTKTSLDLVPGTTLDLEFQHPSGEALILHCKVHWLQTRGTHLHGLTNNIGMKIIDPPLKYKEFFKSLT